MTSPIPDFNALLVPMQLEAFVLNPAVCGSGAEDDTTARISPVTQPNYTFLRLDKFLLQSDLQDHTDLHNTAPAEVNPRMTNLGARPPVALRHRHGVYIHWVLPRFYRVGVTSGQDVSKQRRRDERARRGLKSAPGLVEDDGSNDSPDFVQPATRWIVIRKLDLDSVQPAAAKTDFADREYEAWVIESDYLWSLDDIPLTTDLQTDLAPFVVGHAGSDVNINQQAEVFIGRKTPLSTWTPNPNLGVTEQPPNISLLQSGNQLFADFQMHNSNVFSVLDNFQYGTEDAPQYLDYAKASYYVLGWHWADDVDPLWNAGKTQAHGASLEGLFMNMLGSDNDPWLEKMSQLRILCHGAMYDVTWDHNNKPANVPADQYNARMVDQTLAATSLGTTPMDAMITYCAARKPNPETPEDVAKLEEDILAIESLLYARDDGVESQRQAKDTIYNWSYQRSQGGSHYHFAGKDGDGQSDTQPVEPDKEAVLKLRELNQTQMLLDACTFSMQQYRWDMFSLWWKYMCDAGNSGDNPDNDKYAKQTKDLSDHIAGLQTRIDDLQQHVNDLLDPSATLDGGEPNPLAGAQPASVPVFYRANDPTVLVGGIESGWPTDYLDKVSVRGLFQTIPSSGDLPDGLKTIVSYFSKLPDVLVQPAGGLVSEFYALRPGGGDSGTPAPGHFYPQFHDTKTTDQRWRDQWGDRQPWFPLYMEWEIEYHHIPLEYWKLDEHTARLSADKLVRYGITVPSAGGEDPPPLWEALKDEQGDKGPDVRVLSGRVLILPQPSFSLSAKVTQLFQNTPPAILDQYLPEADRQFLLDNINKLSYLSSPLSGFTDGILTQAQGSHIKPENVVITDQGETSAAIQAAIVEVAGLTKDRLEMIEGKSAVTPYATLTNFRDDKYSPFKPVVHGQYRFRKLNIIDKFGQALMAIDQKPRKDGPPPIYPCISDFYEPQTVTIDGQLYANTVIQDNIDQTEFLQLPPQINQNARLNAAFVMRIADDPFLDATAAGDAAAKWRPATEWENPIWGWLITNYADYGIQLFLPDGTFYREVRFGGPLGALESPAWLPFAPDDSPPTPQTEQLDALAKKLADRDYLQGFWNMVIKAQANLAAAPTSYAQFLNSIVGKPLALVNMGWSLELDRPPLVNQSTLSGVTDPERQLLPPSDPDDKTPYYQFQVRLGNQDAEYDGLVGYFDTTGPGTDELNLDTVKTFFAPETGTQKPLERLSTENYPIFDCFWEPPFPTAPPYDGTVPIVQADQFEDKRNSHMTVFGAILDVFTPVQAYSSFLPPVSLSLPPWTWQKAMNTMTAFFHAGPLTMPLNDVPAFDPAQLLTSQNAREMPKRDLPLPALGPGEWSWFQPYAVADPPAAADAQAEDDPTPAAKFNPFGIQKRGNLMKPGFQDGPYAAIEGYLQLRNPIQMPKPGTTA